MTPQRSDSAFRANDGAVLLIQPGLEIGSALTRVLESGDLARRVLVVSDAKEAEEYLFREGRYARADGGPVPVFVLLDCAHFAEKAALLRRMRADPRLRRVVLVAVANELEAQANLDIRNAGIILYLRRPDTLAECVRFADQLRQLLPQSPASA